jgi:hypothetical protein
VVTIVPRAAGTRRDLREHTDLAREIPFFGSHAEAGRFYRIGIEPLLASLPQRIQYVDYGGAQGTVARVVRDALRARGFDVRITVVDANERYLADARTKGLQTCLGDIQDVTLTSVDLATMRLVNHYDDEAGQRAMGAAIFRSLVGGAPFVSQIETGSPLVCDLHARIAEVFARASGDAGGHWWPTLDRWIDLLEAAGFADAAVVGASPDAVIPLDQALADAWRRFNGRAMAAAATDVRFAREIDRRRLHEIDRAERLVRDALARHGDAADPDLARGRVRLTYPVVVLRRSNAG